MKQENYGICEKEVKDMEKIIVNVASDTNYDFTLHFSEDMTLNVEANVAEANTWEFQYFVFLDKKWHMMDIEKGKITNFFGNRELLDEQKMREMQKALNELVQQLKNHPTYRLKLLHILDQKTRYMWERV